MTDTSATTIDPISALVAKLSKAPASSIGGDIDMVEAKYGASRAATLRAAIEEGDEWKAVEFARSVLGEFAYMKYKTDDTTATIIANGSVVAAAREASDGVDPLVSAILTATSAEIIRLANSPKTHDPIAATIIRLGLPGGDEFFLDNLDFMRETYGDEITDALRTAYAENDLDKALEFANLLVDGFSYEVVSADARQAEIEYSINGEPTGSTKCSRFRDTDSNPLVLAVLHAVESTWSRARVQARVDAEIAAEEAAAQRP